MRIKPEALKVALSKRFSGLYLVFGAEILLINESLDLIRATAKANGFEDKTSFDVDGNFNWQQIFAEVGKLSLFSKKRIIECRLTSGKIGVKGSKALTEIASSLPADVLFIIIADKLERTQMLSKWFKTLEIHGDIIQSWELQKNNFLNWVLHRMQDVGLEENQAVAQNIALNNEGNLLAAMQEIEKLKIASPDGKIDEASFQKHIDEQSRYTVFGLVNAALIGDSQQVIKIFRTMEQDKSTPIIVSGWLYREIKIIINVAISIKLQNPATAFSEHNIWAKKQPMILGTLKRHSVARLQKLLLALGRIDRSIKGEDNIRVEDKLLELLLILSGGMKWAT